MEISSLRRNIAKVEAGEWVSEIPGFEDARLKVRGMKHPQFVAVRSRKERRVARNNRYADGAIHEQIAMVILGETIAEVGLLDWDGMTDQGKPVPYDSDLAREWLTNPEFMEFADAVVWAMNYVDNMRAGDQEKVAKNSQGSSAGKSSGETAPAT